VLNTFGQDGRTQILASPQVMVLDNEKADIKVSDHISMQTQTRLSTSTGALNSFQYLETGILFGVTPRINSGGMVTLEVNQDVSEADKSTITSANPNPSPNPEVATRNAKTSVQVASGESVVLGGLIREKNGRSTSGVPLLSKIPVLGVLLGQQAQRTELVLIMTPKIVSDTVQAREVSAANCPRWTEGSEPSRPEARSLEPSRKQTLCRKRATLL
jgi:general secretion pathway protein D